MKVKKILSVEGMSCEHCAKRVTEALEKVEGVKKVKVDLKKKSAVVELEGEVGDQTLTDAVVGAGYEVTSIA